MRATMALASAILLGASAGLTAAEGDTFEQRRADLRNRQRRIILNNDGCDALYFPTDRPVTPEEFLKLRTSPLKGSQVDTVFYCSISSGFSNFTHATKIGTVLTREVSKDLGVAGKTNITGPLVDGGTDPLRLVSDWCHANDIECFWSFRMNDTHDGAHRPDKDYPLFPPLKAQHPDYLLGTFADRPKHGAWTAVDYGREEIRDLAFRFVEEVCRGWDVDGVELDFCRHLSYFRSVAYGGEATDDDRAAMSDLMRRIRRMVDAEGRRRGRPILLAVRIPDSIPYCRAVGLDVETWLEEGLLDLVTGGFYLQLNPWSYLADIGRQYDVAVFAGMSESRVRGDVPPFRRNSPESYAGRAAAALQEGVDGVYLFNFFNPEAEMLRHIGDPTDPVARHRLYFPTIVNRNPETYLRGGARFQAAPVLTPENPASIPAGGNLTVPVIVGDGHGAAPAETVVTVNLRLSAADSPAVFLNDVRLGAPQPNGPWLAYPVPPALLKAGSNPVRIEVPARQAEARPDTGWTTVYDASRGKPQPPWTTDRAREGLVCDVVDGALLLADRGEKAGDYMYASFPWNISAEDETVVEAEVKVISGWNNIIVTNGLASERVSLYPDRIQFYEAKLRHPMDLTDGFHTIRVELSGRDIRVFADGGLVLDGAGRYTKSLPGRNDVRFGAANSPSLGEALWRKVSLRCNPAAAALYDLVLEVAPNPDR